MNLKQLTAAEAALAKALDHLARAGNGSDSLYNIVAEAYQTIAVKVDEERDARSA